MTEPPTALPKKSAIMLEMLNIPFKKNFVFMFRERGREGEREGEKHQCAVACCTPPTEGLARNPGMCPDQESNQ